MSEYVMFSLYILIAFCRADLLANLRDLKFNKIAKKVNANFDKFDESFIVGLICLR